MPMIKPAKRVGIYKRDAYTCARCGRQMQPDDPELSLDHKLPRSRGGTNRATNLITMCKPCNENKGDRLPPGVTAPLRTDQRAVPGEGSAQVLRSHFPTHY